MIVTRTQKILIKKSSPYWKQIDEMAFKSKNMYNFTNYTIRQEFIKTSKEKEEGLVDHATIYSYVDLCKNLKHEEPFLAMGSACAQGTIKLVSQNWKSWIAALKDWTKHPDKYKGRPQMPNYLDKEEGRFPFILNTNQVKNADGYVKFSFTPFKNMNNVFKTSREERIYSSRFVPKLPDYVFEIIYQVEVPDLQTEKTSRIASIDIGMNRLMTVVNNCGLQSFAINGKALKSMNRFYNIKVADMKSELMKTQKKHSSKRIVNFTNKRNRKVTDFIHKATTYVVRWCKDNKINTVVCGHNVGWKQGVNLGTQNNQDFVSIPHTTLINQLRYKCENYGIKFIETEESFTSGTSFLDNEEPKKENYDKSRRKTRGLFVANDGTEINADVNGAYQICKKVFDDPYRENINYSKHPIIINL